MMPEFSANDVQTSAFFSNTRKKTGFLRKRKKTTNTVEFREKSRFLYFGEVAFFFVI